MSYDRWHPLDGNMIAADKHYEERAEEEPGECPECGEDLEEDEDDVYCPHCGWEQ